MWQMIIFRTARIGLGWRQTRRENRSEGNIGGANRLINHHLSCAKSSSNGFTIHQLLGKVARAITISKLRNVVMTYDRATASVIDAMLERRLQLIHT